ncbi:MAG: hypothetical protein U0T73_09150 [Chitinophagales bacterium]
MQLFKIFAVNNAGLYAIDYEQGDGNEWDKAFEQWEDPETLIAYFEGKFQDTEDDEFIATQVEQVLEEAQLLRNRIFETSREHTNLELDTLFHPVHKGDYSLFQLSKAYGRPKKSLLRIYAIRVERNMYVVTGSAIKTTRTMQEDPLLMKELNKLERVRDFLREQEVRDGDDLTMFCEL